MLLRRSVEFLLAHNCCCGIHHRRDVSRGVPTYPTLRTMSPGNSRWTYKLHCWTYGIFASVQETASGTESQKLVVILLDLIHRRNPEIRGTFTKLKCWEHIKKSRVVISEDVSECGGADRGILSPKGDANTVAVNQSVTATDHGFLIIKWRPGK